MKYKFSQILEEYSEKNIDNLYEPAAVGKYGVRKRSEIYKKDLSDDYSKNKVIYQNTLTIGMGSKQIDFGVLTYDATYSVSPAYKTFRINTDIIKSEYLELYLMAFNEYLTKKYMIASARQGKKVDIDNLLDDYIEVPDFSTQNTVVSNISKIKDALQLDEELISLYDELVVTCFDEYFGDPIQNEKNWITKPLLELGKCKNGMNFSYDESGVTINCLGVGDFKDYSFVENTAMLPRISLNKKPAEEYLLKNEDIVFVRSNGNKALVGRSILVYPNDIPTTYSGFCIRYRKEDESIDAVYLLRVLKHESTRRKMAGRGTNIQNLNQKILSSLSIPIPPMELQKKYSEFVKRIEELKTVILDRDSYYSELYNKYMGLYFIK